MLGAGIVENLCGELRVTRSDEHEIWLGVILPQELFQLGCMQVGGQKVVILHD